MGSKLQISEALQAASEKLALVIGSNPLEPVFKKAEVVLAVRDWLAVPEVFTKIEQLQNTPSGFQTDKPEGYDKKTLGLAVTDALCSGFQLVGNEFNIIGGRFMGVLNGYNRQVDTFNNGKVKLVYKEVLEGDITVNGNMVRVPMTIKYKLQTLTDPPVTTEHTFTRTIQLVKRYDKEGPDAWVGKATRRMLKKLLVSMTGYDLGDDLGDEGTAGAGGAPAASTVPPAGRVDLGNKPEPAAAAGPAGASDAVFTDVVAGEKKDPSWTPVPAPEEPPASPEPPKGTKKGKSEAPPAPPSEDVF